METFNCGKRKVKVVGIFAAVISMIGLYILRGTFYKETDIYLASITRSSNPLRQHDYNGYKDVYRNDNTRPISSTAFFSSVSDNIFNVTSKDSEVRKVTRVLINTSEQRRKATRTPSNSTELQRTMTNVTNKSFKESSLYKVNNSEYKRTFFASKEKTMALLGKSLLDANFKSTVNKTGLYNIMATKPINFDKVYKNPCWNGTISNGPIPDNRLHCLPYFYIIGIKKSGTTDMYTRMLEHPEICSPGFKESQWLARLRFGYGASLLRFSQIHELLRKGPSVRGVEFYISMYDQAASCIHSQTEHSKLNVVTGDATPSLMSIHTKWETLPGNEGLNEPRYTNFHYIDHLTPQSKIIILYREPISRLYSDFHHTMQKIKMENAPELFHNHVIRLVTAYSDCFNSYTVRRCVYNNTLQKTLKNDGVLLAESFYVGFYAFFMKELLSVFRRDQILPLLMLDYRINMTATLQKTFRFLGLKTLHTKAMKKMLKTPVQNSGHDRKRHYGTMMNKTKSLLEQFYKPYNEEMAKLMGDSRYLFGEA